MKWRRGRQEQPAASKPDKDRQLREVVSPYGAGLTDDPGKGWDQYLREEFSVESGEEPTPARPAARVPAPRPALDGDLLNLVSIPFPGDSRWRADRDREAG
jgi:hypothetical protein